MIDLESQREDLDVLFDYLPTGGHPQDVDVDKCPYCALGRIRALISELEAQRDRALDLAEQAQAQTVRAVAVAEQAEADLELAELHGDSEYMDGVADTHDDDVDWTGTDKSLLERAVERVRKAEAALAQREATLRTYEEHGQPTWADIDKANTELTQRDRFIEFCLDKGMVPTRQARVIFARAEEGSET